MERQYYSNWKLYRQFHILISKNPEYEELICFFNGNKNVVYVGFGNIDYDSIGSIYLKVTGNLIRNNLRIILPKNTKKIFDSNKNMKDIFFVNFMPFDFYFSKLSFAIHHGDYGTVYTCLKHAISQLVLSFGADQNFWGEVKLNT